MANHIHRHRRLIADGSAIAPDLGSLHVCRGGYEHVAFPPPGREAAVRTRSVGRGMWTPIHPDRRYVAIDPGADLPGHQPGRDRIEFVPDMKTEWAEHDVERRVIAALPV